MCRFVPDKEKGRVKHMTDIIFSFDTEDFTSNITADAIYREAEILREEGVRGGFCLVGLLTEQLQNWGRTDIIGALKHHDILTHSYSHSVHPTINELTDLKDFDAAYHNIFEQEKKALSMIKAFTGGADICGVVTPGNNISYVGSYVFADLGLPINSGSACDTVDSRGAFFCNAYHTRYNFEMETFHEQSDDAFMKKTLDELSKRDRAVICTHPNRAIAKEFWDQINYNAENQYEFGKWAESPYYTEEEIEAFYDAIRRFVRMVKNDNRFRVTNYKELADKIRSLDARVIRKEDLPAIKEQLEKDFWPIAQPSYCISDVFLACVEILRGKTSHTCGKVYGFLETPYAAEHELTVTKEELIASAEAMDCQRFLPEKIRVGSHDVGPADWLMAALTVLCGEEAAVVSPKAQMPNPDILGDVKTMDLRLDGTYIWPPQSRDFKDEYLSDRMRLQTWTTRFM